MATELDLVIRAPRMVGPAGELSGVVGVSDGTIAVVENWGADLAARQVVELRDDEVLLPGLVDTHVHVNEPGRTEWEGFTTATKAAAAGGVTTLLDMPLNSIPPTVESAALETKRKAAQSQAFVDVGFWGGAVPGNERDLPALHHEGVFGFKCFLLPSGVDEFPPLDRRQLEQAMRQIAAFDGLLIVHAEDPDVIEHSPRPHGSSYPRFLASRPRGAESLAIAETLELARWIGCRLHILHVSSSDALDLIASARRDGVRVTADTCPHYLTFCAEEISDGATEFKCCPPIRERDNRERLWAGLGAGAIDLVVSDHSPATVDLKRLDTGDFGAAWGGISSLQLGLSAVWTGARERGLSLADVAGWMCAAPARLVGLHRKGRLAPGSDADFCILAPEEEFVVDVRRLQHKNPVSAYDGRRLTGAVRSTWLRGERINIDAEPRGRLLARGGA
ncbi:MAG: allantoinase AllB [Nocardioidaceae bacterium]